MVSAYEALRTDLGRVEQGQTPKWNEAQYLRALNLSGGQPDGRSLIERFLDKRDLNVSMLRGAVDTLNNVEALCDKASYSRTSARLRSSLCAVYLRLQ